MAKLSRRELGIAAAASLVLAALLTVWFARGRREHEATPEPDPAAASERGAGPKLGEASDRTHLELHTLAKATIRGSVRDAEGAAIPNARVCAISKVEARRGLDDRAPHCVRSGPDGRYAIDGLLPIETEVHASAPTFKPARWELAGPGWLRTSVPLAAGPGLRAMGLSEIDLILEPGGVLVRGVVKDIAGGEIERAQVVLLQRRQGSAFTVTGEHGEFEQWVTPGGVEVYTHALGYADGAVAAVAPGEFVELFMTPESVLVGRVVLADSGEPVANAVVSAGASTPSPSDGAPTRTQTDGEGRFRLDRLQPGSFKPSAETDRLWGQAAEQVHLGLGATSEELVIRVHPAALVQGRVVIAGSDRPCPSGNLRLTNLDGRNWSDLDHEGRAVFRGLLPGAYQVRVYCRGFIPAEHYPELVVGEGVVDELEWEVREGRAIRGVVLDDAGEPAMGVEVTASPIVDPDALRSQTTRAIGPSQADGGFELTGLLPGRYELTTRGIEPVVVELQSGSDLDEVHLVLPGFGRVRGRVVDETGEPVSGATIMAARVGGQGSGWGRSNDAGEFEIDELALGSTRVTANDGPTWGRGAVMRKPGTDDDALQGELVEIVANEVVEVALTVEAQDGRITGVVTDALGSPVVDAFVDVERIPEGAGTNSARARRSVRWSWGSQPILTDAEGRFELEGLPEGEFIIRANRKGGGEALAERVALGSHVELVVSATGELAGTVELADHSTPERFSVVVEDEAQGLSLYDSFFRTDGRWRLSEVPPGRYAISVSSVLGTATHDPALELGPAQVLEGIELILDPRVGVGGRVIDLDTREPVAGLTISVSGKGSSSGAGGDSRDVTDNDGRFELDDVAVGPVGLTAWERAPYDYVRQPLVIAATPAVQDLGDIELVARRLGANEDAGDLGYRLDDGDPSLAPEEFKPVVAAVRADGPAASAGLLAGDVIEKVQGHDVLGTHGQRYAILTRVPEGTTLTLELAGGRTVELVTGPAI